VSASTAYILYLVFALGGAGVYLLLPKTGRPKTMAGGVVGVSALALFLTLLAARVVPADETTVWFYLFAAIAVVAGARVITHPRPVFSALYFVLVVVAVAALLVLQRAEFLAVALVIIYAGAIVVTYLFVIMLAQERESPTYDRRAREPLLAVLCGFVLMAAVAGQAGDLPEPPADTTTHTSATDGTESATPPAEGNTAAIGTVVMTRYVVALEITGVLLLVAMIGAIAMSKKKVPTSRLRTVEKPIGQVGKEVPPY
jgi:NADH-quinone oxidoreductase subunit J